MELINRLNFLLKAKNHHFLSVDSKFFSNWKYLIMLIIRFNPYYKPCIIHRKKFKSLKFFVVVGLKYSGNNVKRRTSGFAKNYVYKNRGCKCVYCEEELNYENATADHIIPISNGGNNTQVNLLVCCSDCNNERGNMPFKDYLKYKNKKYKNIKFI